MNKHSVRSLACILIVCGVFSAQSGYAQNNPALASDNTPKKNSRSIEEVIVTAQKRDEALQDVPISMSVMDANFMIEQGVTDLREALLYVPNVQVEAAGFFSAPRARGFTFNNNNKAFEPPLGLAIDGIPYTRIPYFLAATFDLKRIEVLRGPQGTTFGKNTTAGLIHMLTADPTEEWSGSVSAQAGEYERERLEAVVSGPIVPEKILFRVGAFVEERDGFVDNTTHDVEIPSGKQAQENFRGNDRRGVRLKLHMPDLAKTSLKLTYEDVYLEDLGTGFEIIRATQEVRDFLLEYDPNTDFEAGNYVASLDDEDGRRVSIETVNIQWDIPLDDWNLIFVGGYSLLEQELALDTDFTPAPAVFGLGSDSSPTTTAELRVVSPRLDGLFGLRSLFGRNTGTSDFVAGLFYQDRAINDSEFRFIFDQPAFLGLTTAASSSDSQGGFGVLPNFGEGDFVEDFTQNFEQQAETIALFGEFKWNFLEEWTFQAGARAGTEKKSADFRQVYNQAQEAIILTQAGVEEFETQRSLEENQFQYKVSLNWQPKDNISLFFHVAESVKGGGYNAFAFRNVDDEIEYDPEFTLEYALNAKTSWLDNTLAINLSLFRMEVEDFQVLSRDASRTNIGIGVTLVRNASEAISQGLEGDIQWRPLDWLTIIGAIGYNETEYVEFTQNECPADMPSEDGCDVTGSSFPFAPEWNNTLTALVRTPILDSAYEFTASATIEQFSSQNLDVDLDPRKEQAGFERYKASVGIGNAEQGWSFKVVGENLTNRATGIRQGDLFAGVFVEIAEQPRTIYAQLRYDF